MTDLARILSSLDTLSIDELQSILNTTNRLLCAKRPVSPLSIINMWIQQQGSNQISADYYYEGREDSEDKSLWIAKMVLILREGEKKTKTEATGTIKRPCGLGSIRELKRQLRIQVSADMIQVKNIIVRPKKITSPPDQSSKSSKSTESTESSESSESSKPAKKHNEIKKISPFIRRTRTDKMAKRIHKLKEKVLEQRRIIEDYEKASTYYASLPVVDE